MKRPCAWLCLLLLPCEAQQPAAAKPAEHGALPDDFPALHAQVDDLTISESKQYRIRGAEPRVRGSISFLAEQAKKDFLALSADKDEWKVPVSLILYGKLGDAIPKKTIVFELGYDENGFALLIHAHLAQGMEEEKFRSAVITALLYERALRKMNPGPLDDKVLIRPWLVEGIAEAFDWKSGKRDKRLYQAIYQAGGLYDMEDLLATSQAQYEIYDGAMRSAFRVSAGALVMALLEQPDGTEGFRAFLGEAANFGGDMPVLLRKHFPELNISNKSLEKWWALQMANMSRNSLHDVMSIADTERTLEQILKLQFRSDDGQVTDRELSAWEDLLKLEDGPRSFGIRHAQEEIVRLSYRCFPSYRQVLDEYQAILHILVTKKETEKIAEKLASLEKRRFNMNQTAQRASDYLDWFEITRARETTGLFDDYIRLKKRIDQGLRQNDDHISRYLDKIQALYER